jgi:Spy/CpxP family protein refolding chaperone
MKNRMLTKKKLLGMSLAVAIAGSAAVANAGPHFFKDHGMKHPIEKMIKRLDLSEEQEVQVEEILATVRDKSARKERFKKMSTMLALDPESADYMEQVEAQATQASEKVKARIIEMATARKDIHAILNEEQKADLQRMVQKKMKKMEERCEDDD